ncbi:hypothetical protein [Streptomyces collinus]|uniref:hypothetical protein n=1 Tax=Streptomyces collinus TaxID=42684 RepID=UPI002943309B|nr:hypothetical protein [Streptomyces collinus]
MHNRTSVRDSSRETCIWEMPSSSRQLPPPAPASSLAADDAPLGLYSVAHLIQNSYSVGLAHADALRRRGCGDGEARLPWPRLHGHHREAAVRHGAAGTRPDGASRCVAAAVVPRHNPGAGAHRRRRA